jgi:hypothetical protein
MFEAFNIIRTTEVQYCKAEGVGASLSSQIT